MSLCILPSYFFSQVTLGRRKAKKKEGWKHSCHVGLHKNQSINILILMGLNPKPVGYVGIIQVTEVAVHAKKALQ